MGRLGWRRGRFVRVACGGRGGRLLGLCFGLVVGLVVSLEARVSCGVGFVRGGLAFDAGVWVWSGVVAFAVFAGAGGGAWPQGGASIMKRSWGWG